MRSMRGAPGVQIVAVDTKQVRIRIRVADIQKIVGNNIKNGDHCS